MAVETSGRLQRLWAWLRQHAQLRVVLPVAVGVGLVAYVISVAIAPKSGGQIWAIVRETWWIVLLLTIPYLAIRAFIWRRLLMELQITIPRRTLLVSFAAGEITKVLPAGIYVENYLLARLAHFRRHAAARSSMATTAMLGLEAFVAVPILLIVGLPGQHWVFWTVLGIVGAWLVLLGAAWLLVNYGAHHLTSDTWTWLRRVTEFLDEFLAAGGDLIRWRTALYILPAAGYMLVYVADLYVVTRALGIHSVSFLDAVSVYSFIVLTVILIPVPTELGLTEFSGLSALLAYGIDRSTAAIIMLGLRMMATGMTILVAGATLIVLHSEFSHPQTEMRGADTQGPHARSGAAKPQETG